MDPPKKPSCSWGLQIPKRRKYDNVIFKDAFEDEKPLPIASLNVHKPSVPSIRATNVETLKQQALKEDPLVFDYDGAQNKRKSLHSSPVDDKVVVLGLVLY